MALEIPARVDAVPGARVVEFPWASASAVLTAINDTAATLSASLESRSAMDSAITEWHGAYRDEFDKTYTRLTAAASDLVERAPGRAQSVVNAADDANTTQTRANERADDPSMLDWLPRS